MNRRPVRSDQRHGWKLFGALAIAVSLCRTANAQIKTGMDLYRICAIDPSYSLSLKEIAESTNCAFYLWGYMSAVVTAEIVTGNSIACIPDGVSPNQVNLVFRRWATNHPEWLSKPAAFVLATALAEVWPCKRIAR